jgi:uncharacterized protein YeaO (DUF488 family)
MPSDKMRDEQTVAGAPMTRRHAVQVRRIYDQPAPGDGIRVLVDRVWPRGIRKEAAAIDLWAKDVAPSTELRKWYGHVPEKIAHADTRHRAARPTRAGRPPLNQLRTLAARDDLTLVTATRDVDHSQATVLARVLNETR